MRIGLAALAALACLAGCGRKPLPVPPHVVLGAPYEAGGLWRYPRESYSGDETGLAEIATRPHPRLTTDGEVFDPKAMAIAHPTLQLPAIGLLTDLDTGRAVRVRINDRGPSSPARLVAVTPRVAALLGFGASGVARVRLDLDEAASRSAVAALGGGPVAPLAIETAPRAAITSSDLPPPGSGRDVGPTRPIGPTEPPETVIDAPPLHLPEVLTAGPAAGGSTVITLGQFGRRVLAERQAARSGEADARVDAIRLGRETAYRALVGPFPTTDAADAALARILHAGVLDARIVIE